MLAASGIAKDSTSAFNRALPLFERVINIPLALITNAAMVSSYYKSPKLTRTSHLPYFFFHSRNS
jgi:hypothetical protein